MESSFLVTLYDTLASIIGLILTVIGAAMLINLVLTTYILNIPRYPSMPPAPYLDSSMRDIKTLEEGNTEELTEDDRVALDAWKASYEQWNTEQKTFDRANVDKKNQLATSISMLGVGIPVLWFHQKELRKKS